MAKAIYDTINQTVLPYPRNDDEPVVGLDPNYLEMVVLQEPEPEGWDPATSFLNPTETVDTDNRVVIRGWEVLPVSPDPISTGNYISFYNSLVQSPVYQTVLSQATQSTELLAYLLAFISALSDAKTGRPNQVELQNAINLIFSVASLDAPGRLEIQSLLEASNLEELYSLPEQV